MIENPRDLLQRYDLWPRKSLGQNFLVDPKAPARIAECADLTRQDTVLEVGAGTGVLTAALAARAGRVIAVETDPQLVELLPTTLSDLGNVEIVAGDILALNPRALLGLEPVISASSMPLWGPLLPGYQVVANLPYYITNAVVRHLLEAEVRPERMVITVQREVAQRMAADPGDMSLLAVAVQFYGRPRICMRLGNGAFYPVPKVASAVVRIDLHATPPVDVDDVELFFRVVRGGFAQRRKQLRNTLASTLHLEPQDVEDALAAHDFDHRRRAETLAIKEWGQVYRALVPLL